MIKKLFTSCFQYAQSNFQEQRRENHPLATPLFKSVLRVQGKRRFWVSNLQLEKCLSILIIAPNRSKVELCKNLRHNKIRSTKIFLKKTRILIKFLCFPPHIISTSRATFIAQIKKSFNALSIAMLHKSNEKAIINVVIQQKFNFSSPESRQ